MIDKKLEEIKKLYGVDIQALRTDDSREDDKTLRKKRKFKNSFYIPCEIYKNIENFGIIKDLIKYRAIHNNFDVESNGGFGYILTPKVI